MAGRASSARRASTAVLAVLGVSALALLAGVPAAAVPAGAPAAPPAAAQAASPGAAAAGAAVTPTALPPGISGDYLEARTADVYTGPCFANSEVDLAGKQAVVAWRVRQGAWQGVPLDGLAVVAAVRSAATLGDPFGGPLDAAALLVVDRRATPVQRDALVAFAHAMSGDLLSRVVAVESAPIEMALGGQAEPPDHAKPSRQEGPPGQAYQPGQAERTDQAASLLAGHAGHHRLAAGLAVAGVSGEAHLKAGDWVDLTTRGIGPKDHLCGNEELFYPPLTAGRSRVTAVPAVTVAYDFRGPGLGMVWSSPGRRSAFVGHFAN
jgi:hypothetical protein